MKKFSKSTLCLMITLFILTTSYYNGNIVYAQENEVLEIIDLKYPMYEYADKIGQVNNTESIGIALPSDTWNLTKLDLNFTDIKLGEETKEFEVYNTSFTVIERSGNNYGYGVQINILEPTTIYGTYIYGYKNILANKILKVQINGYNPATNAPNATIYGTPTDFNITKDPGWFYQNFENPINLSIGKYFLVVDGSNVFTAQDKYYWGFNDNGQFPDLYVSRYDGNIWNDGVVNSTLLYKLVQSTSRIYYPQEINMTIEIENTNYSILNGNSNGTGYVKIPNLNYSPDTNFLQIPVKSNTSPTLNFSYSYFLGIKNEFDADGSVILELDQDINWKIEPLISRIEENYSIEFFYPDNWYNIKVHRNGVLVNSELNVVINTDEKCVYLENNSIIDGATWSITALSSQEILDINFPIIEFEPNQELRFSIELPQVNGYVSWRLIDPWDFEEFSEIKEVNSITMTFSYQIPEKPHEGDYVVIFFWYNDNTASVASQNIKITVPFALNPMFIISIIIIIGIILLVGTGSYITIKRVKNNVQRDRQKLVYKCMDVNNMNYFMVIDKESGLCVYEENFTGKKIDSGLISGFLDAIRSFGFELIGSYQQSKTIKLEYRDSKILMVDFKNFRVVFIMKENPSDDFLESITELSFEIDEEFGHLLSNFNNDVTPFRAIKNLVKKHLNTLFLAPLRIVENKNIKLNSAEKNEINRALEFMSNNSLDYFYTSFLLNQNDYEPGKIKVIFALIEKNIFQLYNIEKAVTPKEINEIIKKV